MAIDSAKKVYVASSWRNRHQPDVVLRLRDEGFEVYDFRHPKEGDNGFAWSSIDPEWQSWSPRQYQTALSHPLAEAGFSSDMNALKWCDICIMVMPCGPSASMEMGWAAGAGKPVAVYLPDIREPDLMIKMADVCSTSLDEICRWALAASRPEGSHSLRSKDVG